MATEHRKKVIRAMFDVMVESIHECGGIPSGHLYQALSQKIGMSLETYNLFLDQLVSNSIVKRENHFLTVNVQVAKKFEFLQQPHDPAKCRGCGGNLHKEQNQ